MYDSSDGRFWLRCVLVLPFPGCATHTVRRSDAPRCTVRFGAKGLMSTLMRVRISSDAPRCTVQFGALDPRCTMVQVHGDPNEPSLGAGAAGAPCVTLAAGQLRFPIITPSTVSTLAPWICAHGRRQFTLLRALRVGVLRQKIKSYRNFDSFKTWTHRGGRGRR